MSTNLDAMLATLLNRDEMVKACETTKTDDALNVRSFGKLANDRLQSLRALMGNGLGQNGTVRASTNTYAYQGASYSLQQV